MMYAMTTLEDLDDLPDDMLDPEDGVWGDPDRMAELAAAWTVPEKEPVVLCYVGV